MAVRNRALDEVRRFRRADPRQHRAFNICMSPDDHTSQNPPAAHCDPL
jgi:hypothetical protein